jgi:hypothetical protein
VTTGFPCVFTPCPPLSIFAGETELRRRHRHHKAAMSAAGDPAGVMVQSPQIQPAGQIQGAVSAAGGAQEHTCTSSQVRLSGQTGEGSDHGGGGPHSPGALLAAAAVRGACGDEMSECCRCACSCGRDDSQELERWPSKMMVMPRPPPRAARPVLCRACCPTGPLQGMLSDLRANPCQTGRRMHFT